VAARDLAGTSDARLREALDAMPHKVWMVRPDGPAIYYNRVMREFAGAALNLPDRPSREKALIHADDLGRVAAARDRALVDHQDWSLEVRLKCPDGSWRWHRLNFSMLWGRGRVEAWLATATDIHDLREALRSAQESGEQLRLAAEAAQLGTYSFDLQTREHVWSPELKAIFGLPPGAVEPQDIMQWIHPGDRDRVRASRQASFDPQGSGVFEDEHRIVRPDGSMRWVFVKGRISFAGEGENRVPKRGVGFVLDITERKAAEQALVASEERYRAIVDNANDIVATLDLQFRFVSVNPAVERILGYTPEEIVGTPLDDYVPPDQLATHKQMLQQKLHGSEATQYEMQLLAKDRQRRFTLEVNSKLLRDGDGRPVAIHAIARDVTERKDASARQTVLIRELQHRTKNMLAVVQSIATRTMQRSPDLERAHEALIGRLHALAHAQEFVASGAGGGALLRDLVEAQLASFGARAHVAGPTILAGSSFAQMFALIVHELATNAAKHGALASPSGRVAITWKVGDIDGEPALQFSWIERGGDRIEPPTREGFGTELIGMLGVPTLSFGPEGFEYALAVPLTEVAR
jgi:PAS domain S-box-containing protein